MAATTGYSWKNRTATPRCVHDLGLGGPAEPRRIRLDDRCPWRIRTDLGSVTLPSVAGKRALVAVTADSRT